MDKDTAKTLLIANLKGNKLKRSSLLSIAEAVRTLLNNDEYGSVKKLAQGFNVSRATIESFDRINDQPEEIKKRIARGEILLDASTKLASISDKRKRVKLAKEIAGLSAFDTRYIIDYCKRNPDLTPKQCRKAVLDSKTITKEIHVVVVPLEEERFKLFQNISQKKGLKIDQAAREAIEQWMLRQDGEK
jgi:hypothetical protein